MHKPINFQSIFILCGPKLDKTNTSYLLILPQENRKVLQYYIGLRSLQGDLSVKIKHFFKK